MRPIDQPPNNGEQTQDTLRQIRRRWRDIQRLVTRVAPFRENPTVTNPDEYYRGLRQIAERFSTLSQQNIEDLDFTELKRYLGFLQYYNNKYAVALSMFLQENSDLIACLDEWENQLTTSHRRTNIINTFGETAGCSHTPTTNDVLKYLRQTTIAPESIEEITRIRFPNLPYNDPRIGGLEKLIAFAKQWGELYDATEPENELNRTIDELILQLGIYKMLLAGD